MLSPLLLFALEHQLVYLRVLQQGDRKCLPWCRRSSEVKKQHGIAFFLGFRIEKGILATWCGG